MLNVVLQDDLKDYLNEHHKSEISLRLIHNDYSTGNINTELPRIRFKAPDDIENFDSYTVDGIRVFVDKEVQADGDTIEFYDESLLGIHRCHVKGVRLDNKLI